MPRRILLQGRLDGRNHDRELDLAGSLAVLSACERGGGDMVGVGAVTSELMEAFCRALAAAEPPSNALRSAKLALRRGAYSDPLYWAPFVLTTQAL